MKKSPTSPLQLRLGQLAEATLHSYAQIFFARTKAMGIVVLLVSFMDPQTGLGGILGVLLANGMAFLLGFNRQQLADGLLGINSLFVSMALAANYEFNGQFFLMLAIASVFTVFATVAISAWLGKYSLPALSLPFMIAIWILFMALRSMKSISFAAGDPFLINRLYGMGGSLLVDVYDRLQNTGLPEVVTTYLKSLGAIIFESNVVAGVVLAIALFLRSRIAFTLSLVGFAMGYLYYDWMGGNLGEFHYQAIGYNFILTGIALGSFFFVPTARTYLMVIVITPLTQLAVGAAHVVFADWSLPIYSFPYACIAILILYVSQFTYKGAWFPKVLIQHYSPEKNLYAYLNYRSRFRNNTWFQLGLPFFGEWKVTQGHAGKVTHKGDYAQAWDFTVCDQAGRSFEGNGLELTQYYSYNLPVQAPADGWVVAVENAVEDNAISQPNVRQNWGNSIVIKHDEQFYSQLSHLKKGSISVQVGDYVRKGQVIGKLGNSGRSPEPHLHFQLQATPHIGSKTLAYPVAHYLRKTPSGFEYCAYDFPAEGEVIANIATTELLVQAFRFVPGQRFQWQVTGEGAKPQTVHWEVFTNSVNKSYLYCHATGAIAWFENDGAQHYFTSFEGDKRSLLYHFYLGAYKVLLGYYKGVDMKDILPAHQVEAGPKMWLQDMVAAFWMFRETRFHLRYTASQDTVQPKEIKLMATITKAVMGREQKIYEIALDLAAKSIQRIVVTQGGRALEAQLIEEEMA